MSKSGDKATFKCPKCGKELPTASGLTGHMYWSHNKKGHGQQARYAQIKSMEWEGKCGECGAPVRLIGGCITGNCKHFSTQVC